MSEEGGKGGKRVWRGGREGGREGGEGGEGKELASSYTCRSQGHSNCTFNVEVVRVPHQVLVLLIMVI